MKTNRILFTALLVAAVGLTYAEEKNATTDKGASLPSIPDRPGHNRLIDYAAFLRNASNVAALREQHRVTESRFLDLAQDSATVIFDARSDEKYNMLHIKGAKHLSLPDITADELAGIFPNKSTRILIYCNNNFLNEPRALPSKAPSASLNIYTFNTLYSYGYTNVYELGPLLDIKTSKLEFAGLRVSANRK